jgi:hypothetical protein
MIEKITKLLERFPPERGNLYHAGYCLAVRDVLEIIDPDFNSEKLAWHVKQDEIRI